MKRIISFFAAFVLLIVSFGSISIFANAATTPTLAFDSKSVKKGETVSLNLSIKDNPGISGLEISLKYDTNALTLTGTTKGTLFSGFTASKNFLWDEVSDVTDNGLLATFTFAVSESTKVGDYTVDIIVRCCTNEDLDDVSCNVRSGKITVSCSHSWNSGTVTNAATCKSTGVKTYTCTACKATKTETIAKNSSNHTGGTAIKNAKSATCTSEGYTGDKYCSGCGAKLSSGKAIAKTGHSYNSGTIITAATCTKAGVKTYTCTVCKATKTEKIDALGHNFNGASRTNSDGSISYKCTRCDEYGNTVYPQPTEKKLDAISGTKRITENNLDILVAPVEMTAESIFKAAKGGKLTDSSGNEITNGNTPLATGMKILLDNSEVRVSILGDVDCDGDIDVADARFALRAAVKLDTLTDVCFTAADIDFSKDISVSDARLILRAAVKLDDPKDWLK